MANIHASCISYRNQGILIIGESGFGKSDLTLRMIMEKGAVLVADDRTDLAVNGSILQASCPKTIEGLLEVRGIGIQKMPYTAKTDIKLVVRLAKNSHEIDRLPETRYYEFENLKIEEIKLCAFEASALDKLVIKMDSLLD